MGDGYAELLTGARVVSADDVWDDGAGEQPAVQMPTSSTTMTQQCTAHSPEQVWKSAEHKASCKTYLSARTSSPELGKLRSLGA
ncbi:hypothetical protein GCM10023335_81880 [Streptomyces siamensis]|uniref:Uncharacterized protein n=1 Tax=Streptomyces siamensis TaxID=1274986 RepID=A0ABP9JM03_9ACTN